MRAALLAFIGLLAASAAHAGDWADRAILGFSPDGSSFAFEEFGIRDGSGFPYSTIHVIDTATSSTVGDTPVRVTIEDRKVSLDEARSRARAEAQPVLEARGIGLTNYRTVASNPPTELSADPHAVRFLTDLNATQPFMNWELKVTPLSMDGGPYCASFGPANGFRLTLYDRDGNWRHLHEDRTLPEDRLCPYDYAITDVIIYRPENRDPVMVVLLNLIRQGYKGPDRRYLAVTAQSQDF